MATSTPESTQPEGVVDAASTDNTSTDTKLAHTHNIEDTNDTKAGTNSCVTKMVPGIALQRKFRHMYRNVNCLAPMVRAGTLPLRLLCLRQGAHLVYSEELIDHSLVLCTRKVNAEFDTVEYVMPGTDSVIFSTCAEEKKAVILQLGTANADRAVKVAIMMQNDIAGVDVNMGCPKPYSVLGGMGAALLSKPDTIKELLTSLVAAVSVPVTCKIRILDTVEQTVELVKVIEATGVAAVGIHGRRIPQRPREQANYEHIKAVRAAIDSDFPIIANGGSLDYVHNSPHLVDFREASGCDSIMMARAAQWNPALFKDGQVKHVCKRELSEQYLKIAMEHGHVFENAKWNVMNLLHFDKDPKRARGVSAARGYQEICTVLGCEAVYKSIPAHKLAKIGRKRPLALSAEDVQEHKAKKLKEGIIASEDSYVRKEWAKNLRPKLVVTEWLRKNQLAPIAVTHVEQEGKRGFQSVVTVDGKKYTSLRFSSNKKDAEHAACVVAIEALNIPHERLRIDTNPEARTNAVKGVSVPSVVEEAAES
ncbi:hypothetical protein SARC_08750 [Sphaeroforma arctica JP610]|uniref:DRBM domain-containing protein n=1 Tax=Sphaeroforma arctica JP610 TaxID=667725 RepID=A0A0L0FS75_9EUKA|nr:hypothetical protein SARC_08750 [Sphaeroforma arctica JP610]KNC78833.1 hypothetical protein SARC_08750 [Sphaeroforma arctica JP610]|eukprot:XP_014152735.1 hypothetical protein SARC_08750 [Sphaeroforma arctica JP610]